MNAIPCSNSYKYLLIPKKHQNSSETVYEKIEIKHFCFVVDLVRGSRPPLGDPPCPVCST